MYEKRIPWDTSDYAGKNVTWDEIGLPKPVSLPEGTSKEERDKIEEFLDSLAGGVPEIKFLG
jgi:hypothetical protein